MTRRDRWYITLFLICFLITVLAGLTVIPQLVYPQLTDAELRGVSSADVRIQLQQVQSQLQNGVRSAVLQSVAGLLVVLGAIGAWRQVQVNREGQTTERFTRAVDQIGSENIDVRIGGIYALERVARNSASDRPQIQYVLGAFVRGHSPWQESPAGGPEHPTTEVDRTLPWLYVRAPDVQAAMNVLGRRPPAGDALHLYLSRVDLRSANLYGANLADAIIRHSNLARVRLGDVRLDRAELQRTDLRQAMAVRTCFANANLREAHLEGADLRAADLRGADLRGADMRARHLDSALLTGALADATTVWPPGFDPSRVVVNIKPATPEDFPPSTRRAVPPGHS
ncbi:pentapeptide repeat-containing protein [Amycolatopsis sp. NPDC004772]